MISIFNKKKYLVDLLKDSVDIHNHILPGIDDGAQTINDSIDLIKGFLEIGVSNFIATPHIMHNYHNNTPETISKALQVLKEELIKSKIYNVHIAASAEHMIDDNFEAILLADKVMPMRNEYLLVEMSYLQPPINFDESVTAIAYKRYFQILAHPERYNFLHARPKKYLEYKRRGILFQLNALSLGDFYGKEVQKMAYKLLEEEFIDFMGSDVHNMNQLNALKEVTITTKTKEQLVPIITRTIENFY